MKITPCPPQMIEQDIDAVRKCANWIWGAPYPLDSHGNSLDLTRHETHCVLWIACQAQLVIIWTDNHPSNDELSKWWNDTVASCGWRTPIENLKALAEALNDV